jgi:hypothetical protein
VIVWMATLGMTLRQRQRPEPRVRFEAPESQACWQFDASISETRSKGKVERCCRTVQERFETRFHCYKPDTAQEKCCTLAMGRLAPRSFLILVPQRARTLTRTNSWSK